MELVSGSSCEALAFFQIFLGHLELRCRSFDRLLSCVFRTTPGKTASHTYTCLRTYTYTHSCLCAYSLNDCGAICMARLLLCFACACVDHPAGWFSWQRLRALALVLSCSPVCETNARSLASVWVQRSLPASAKILLL